MLKGAFRLDGGGSALQYRALVVSGFDARELSFPDALFEQLLTRLCDAEHSAGCLEPASERDPRPVPCDRGLKDSELLLIDGEVGQFPPNARFGEFAAAAVDTPIAQERQLEAGTNLAERTSGQLAVIGGEIAVADAIAAVHRQALKRRWLFQPCIESAIRVIAERVRIEPGTQSHIEAAFRREHVRFGDLTIRERGLQRGIALSHRFNHVFDVNDGRLGVQPNGAGQQQYGRYFRHFAGFFLASATGPTTGGKPLI